MTQGSRWVVLCFAFTGVACGAGDNRVDPSDLGLRDLLGVAPDVAAGWTAAQRAAARHVFAEALRGPPEALRTIADRGDSAEAPDAALDDRATRSLVTLDSERASDGRDPLAVVRVYVASDTTVEISPQAAPRAARELGPAGPHRATPDAGPDAALWLADTWDTSAPWALPDRGLALLDALAADARMTDPGPIVVVPAPRLSVIAAYVAHAGGVPSHLAINPVALAAIDPAAAEPSSSAVAGASRDATTRSPALPRWSPAHGAAPNVTSARSPSPVETLPDGNPYAFYGSFEECAQVQRTRCEACLSTGNCDLAPTDLNGNDECAMLADNSGRGYFLLCINLSLAIGSVERCTVGRASCTADRDAADNVARLDANARFLDTPACAGALDGCLAKIYGAPDQPFPGLDGGSEPPEPPRTTSVTCGHACDHDNANCTLSPNLDCGGASCKNGGDCNCDCDDDSDRSSGGSCGSSGSASSCNSTSDSTPNCNSGSGSASSSSDSCKSCDSGSGSDSSCSGCGSGSGNSDCSKCNTAPASPGPALALVSLLWGLLPIPVAARLRRRRQRRGSIDRTAPPSGGAAGRGHAPAVDGSERRS